VTVGERAAAAAAAVDPRVSPRPSRAWPNRQALVNLAFAGVLVGLIVVAALTTDGFFTDSNLRNLSRQMVTTGLLSLGMLVVIYTGGIDLSVGSILALAGILATGLSESMPIPLAMAVGVAAGIACGAVNGVLVGRFLLAPFIVTLATLTTIRGLAFVYSETPIQATDVGFLALGTNQIGPVPISTVIMLAAFAAAWVFINRSAPGRATVAIGGNSEAVRLAGISVPRHLVLAYVISGFCAGLAGVILASRVGIAQPSVGVAFELDAIAACVIGGASLAGGRGSVVGTLFGVVVLALIDNLLNFYGVQSFWQQVLKGLIIVVVVLARRRDA
jgi:ribose/xylose/arabinose/galactoside ABC-type transport system permease subunit